MLKMSTFYLYAKGCKKYPEELRGGFDRACLAGRTTHADL